MDFGSGRRGRDRAPDGIACGPHPVHHIPAPEAGSGPAASRSAARPRRRATQRRGLCQPLPRRKRRTRSDTGGYGCWRRRLHRTAHGERSVGSACRGAVCLSSISARTAVQGRRGGEPMLVTPVSACSWTLSLGAPWAVPRHRRPSPVARLRLPLAFVPAGSAGRKSRRGAAPWRQAAAGSDLGVCGPPALIQRLRTAGCLPFEEHRRCTGLADSGINVHRYSCRDLDSGACREIRPASGFRSAGGFPDRCSSPLLGRVCICESLVSRVSSVMRRAPIKHLSMRDNQ